MNIYSAAATEPRSVPFYGKTYSFASELNASHSKSEGKGGGDADQQNWPQDFGTPVFYNIIDKLSKGAMVSKRHEPTKTQYAYFKDGSGLGEFVFYFDLSGARSEKYPTTRQPQSNFPHPT